MLACTLIKGCDSILDMIRQILLYKSDKISVYCTPAVERLSTRRLTTYVKQCIAAEKTLIKDISKKYPKKARDTKYTFLFKNFKSEDMLGNCDQEYDDDILIELNAKNTSSLCKTIAHELVHARQFISGQLKYNVKIKYLTYEDDKHRYIYRKQPWEIEAYALQDKGAIKIKRWLLDHVHFNPKLTTSEL
jgi:Zn-dependent peptidase ImmA (M78 family)